MPAHDYLNFISTNEAVSIMQGVHIDFRVLDAGPKAAVLKASDITAPAA
jgi:hypothetical protein